jgi:hypothetical protein
MPVRDGYRTYVGMWRRFTPVSPTPGWGVPETRQSMAAMSSTMRSRKASTWVSS